MTKIRIPPTLRPATGGEREVRASGHAWGLEEFAEGINSVAAPVRDARGKAAAAIHAHGPAYRFPRRAGRSRIAAEVVATAGAIERLLTQGAA